MKTWLKIFVLFCLFELLSFRGYSQTNRLVIIVDSIIKSDLNHPLDSIRTNVSKPQPVIIIDGQLVDRKKLSNFKMKEVNSIRVVSDTLTTELFDKQVWGGIILIRTNLTKRQFKKKL